MVLGRDSSVGIATRYGLDGPGTSYRWKARFSAPVHTGSRFYPALGVKRLEVDLTTHLRVAPKLKKEYRYTSPPPSPILHGL